MNLFYKNGLLLAIFFIPFAGCSTQPDYSGTYKKISGICSSEIVKLKKVQGFGGKYYLVLTDEPKNGSQISHEFLGVIRGNVITVDSVRIVIGDDRINVIVKNKDCVYLKE